LLTADCGLSYQHLHPQSVDWKDWDPWTLLAMHMAAGSKILDSLTWSLQLLICEDYANYILIYLKIAYLCINNNF